MVRIGCVFCLLKISGDLHNLNAKFNVRYAFSDKTMSLFKKTSPKNIHQITERRRRKKKH